MEHPGKGVETVSVYPFPNKLVHMFHPHLYSEFLLDIYCIHIFDRFSFFFQHVCELQNVWNKSKFCSKAKGCLFNIYLTFLKHVFEIQKTFKLTFSEIIAGSGRLNTCSSHHVLYNAG